MYKCKLYESCDYIDYIYIMTIQLLTLLTTPENKINRNSISLVGIIMQQILFDVIIIII